MKIGGLSLAAYRMRVFVTTESRFDRTPDGACWTVGTAGYAFWRRYLDVFDEVRVVARMRETPGPPQRGRRADGAGVTWVTLPYYVGPWAYMRKRAAIRRSIVTALDPCGAIIVRVPGVAGGLLVEHLRRIHRPYGVEVIGDPFDVFAPGSVQSLLRSLLQWWMPRTLRRQCAGACAASYVTSSTLQDRYPAPNAALVTAYSSIDLPEEAFVHEPRRFDPIDRPTRIILVGSLEQLYKAPDILIDATAIASSRGANLQVTIVGEGRYRGELEARAQNLGLGNCVRFAGHVSSACGVRTELDRADLFILPSRAEGLPRALIEAMARALPCIGSDVGGIPELLAPAERVPAGSAGALAEKICEIVRDSKRLTRLSAENLAKAREYHSDVLQARRKALYQVVHDATQNWQAARQRQIKA